LHDDKAQSGDSLAAAADSVSDAPGSYQPVVSRDALTRARRRAYRDGKPIWQVWVGDRWADAVPDHVVGGTVPRPDR
jgi:hypothetical protein